MNDSLNESMNEPLYQVVINDEEQYSIWPSYRGLPAGWRATGPAPAPKQACLDYIEAHWSDMRPRSLREQADAQ
ncbi:MbtH family protein [Massilia aquatica]|uniref:MbtH family NRPS accessory protein n=1 Tax=Massilia aquatica TaxID=2609000 RepID=A0ABX0MDW9_9BURK|nr:MbtH family NRPS accessory protein [Massilia aquatica]NHZ41749.1 MbtH family NRPS accessory protein [Massilia aquatica]